MKIWFSPFLILSLISSGLLMSCGGQKETQQVIVSSPNGDSKGGTTNSTGNGAGGGDLGGGNIIEGKMIEDYRVLISEEASYKLYVQPILKTLGKEFPELAADFVHITEARTWYIVPVDLKTLDSLRIGIPFEVKTKQVALHTPEVVYIDKRVWKDLEEEQKGLLITHELAMGTKWIEHHEGLDRCLASSRIIFVKNNFSNSTEYQDAKKKCYTLYLKHFINPAKFKLKGEEYDQIRTLTSNLFKFLDKIIWDDLKNWFKAVEFRKY